MKKLNYLAGLLCMTWAACDGQTEKGDSPQAMGIPPASEGYSRPISRDSANKMIGSYLDAINHTVNTNEIRSWAYDAEVLRHYLNSNPGKEMKELKFMLAHNQEYAYSDRAGTPPDSNSNVLTLILVGVDNNGDYLYLDGNQVMDYYKPCPPACFDGGTAASDYLIDQ